MASVACVAALGVAIVAVQATGFRPIQAGPVLVPVWAYVLALVPGLYLATTRPSWRLRRTGRMGSVITVARAAGISAAFIAATQSGSAVTFAVLALLAVVPLSLLWPDPTVLRLSLLLGGIGLLASPSVWERSPWLLVVMTLGAALTLVWIHRWSNAEVPLLDSHRSPDLRPRRWLGEAGVVFALAALVAVLAAALLPARRSAGSGGGGGFAGGINAGGSPGRQVLDPALMGQPLDAGAAVPSGRQGDRVILRVAARAPDFWQVRAFDLWDGRRWLESPDLRSVPAARADGRAERTGPSRHRSLVPPAIGDEHRRGTVLTQRVTVEASAIYYLAAAPRAVSVSGPGILVVNPGGNLLSPMGQGNEYTVRSRRGRPAPAELRAHDPLASPVPEEVGRYYLPADSLSDRARSLAAEVTAAAPSGYEKLEALRHWLAANTVVRAHAPPAPHGTELVDRFLFEDRAGTPAQGATSLALLLRSVGIPARVATGFAGGDRSWLRREFVVRTRHTHVRAEAWFPALGWQPVELPGAGEGPAAGQAPDPPTWWRWLLPLAAAALVLAVVVVRRRSRARALPWATQTFGRLVRAGSARGRPRHPHETAAEYAAALGRSVLPDARLGRVGQLVTVSAYSGRPLGAEERQWADEVVREVVRANPRYRRGRRRWGDPARAGT